MLLLSERNRVRVLQDRIEALAVREILDVVEAEDGGRVEVVAASLTKTLERLP